MEDVGIFYEHLVYFTAIWFTFWTFGTFVVISRLCMIYQEKSGNPEEVLPK
jgi:hypothetical protein